LFQIGSFVSIQTWKEFWLIMLIGVSAYVAAPMSQLTVQAFGFIGQILLTFGLQREKAGRASLAMYLSLFYSLVFELVFFGTVPPVLSLLGAAIIISAAVWVAVRYPSPLLSVAADHASSVRSPSQPQMHTTG
jgi:drug/metabolite transporter (DMT)-like permease